MAQIVYAPMERRPWYEPPPPSFAVVYPACAHKRFMYETAPEAEFVRSGPDLERSYCPSCRRNDPEIVSARHRIAAEI